MPETVKNLLIGKCKECGTIIAGSYTEDHVKDRGRLREFASDLLSRGLVVEWHNEDHCLVKLCEHFRNRNKLMEEELEKLGL